VVYAQRSCYLGRCYVYFFHGEFSCIHDTHHSNQSILLRGRERRSFPGHVPGHWIPFLQLYLFFLTHSWTLLLLSLSPLFCFYFAVMKKIGQYFTQYTDNSITIILNHEQSKRRQPNQTTFIWWINHYQLSIIKNSICLCKRSTEQSNNQVQSPSYTIHWTEWKQQQISLKVLVIL